MLDLQKIRADFPILHQEVHGQPLIYFDNAATSQKPRVVIDALNDYYCGYNSNVHRGAHSLADKATVVFEQTRKAVQAFIGAEHLEEIIFTRGTTEGINLIAQSYGRSTLKAGDEIILSQMEHHSNIVPWQMVAQQTGAVIKVIPVTEAGELDMEAFAGLLSQRTKVVSVVHISNALGTINPVEQIIRQAHAVGAVVLVDGAQSCPHLDIDVQAMDADFYVFSGHKMYGPTGIGILYGKRELLEAMPPYMGGGEMIDNVSFAGTTYNELPYKFEAGTPNIADTIALQTAIAYIDQIGKDKIAAHENELLQYATPLLEAIPKLRLIGTAEKKTSVFSFVVEGVHHYDLGMMLDTRGIAVRTGHHCTQPLMDHLGIAGTVRASLAIYNTKAEVDRFVEELDALIAQLSR
ncbi:MAG: aminotransferase class V-fold PLP-dependent enzyme [Bernardetiaceae bacterium]